MTNLYKNTDESKKEFYFYLGLLSTLFAKMESNLLEIVSRFTTDDFVLGYTIFERNTLSQNIDLAKELSDKRNYEVEFTKMLADKISNTKKIRNLFIHGVWGEPIMKENDLIIRCSESKLDYTEKYQDGKRITRSWGNAKSREFRLSYLRKLVENVEEIILMQNHLLKRLNEFNYR